MLSYMFGLTIVILPTIVLFINTMYRNRQNTLWLKPDAELFKINDVDTLKELSATDRNIGIGLFAIAFSLLIAFFVNVKFTNDTFIVQWHLWFILALSFLTIIFGYRIFSRTYFYTAQILNINKKKELQQETQNLNNTTNKAQRGKAGYLRGGNSLKRSRL